jgi:hypothetical protein
VSPYLRQRRPARKTLPSEAVWQFLKYSSLQTHSIFAQNSANENSIPCLHFRENDHRGTTLNIFKSPVYIFERTIIVLTIVSWGRCPDFCHWNRLTSYGYTKVCVDSVHRSSQFENLICGLKLRFNCSRLFSATTTSVM